MSNLYDKIIELCKNKGITGGRMCNDLHLSRGLMTDLKKGRKKTISTETAIKIANYFDVSVEELYGKNEKPATISDDELDKINSIFNQLSPDNRSKLLELAFLYLDAQRNSKENQ